MHKFAQTYRSYSWLGFMFAMSTALVVAILPVYLEGSGYTESQLGFLFAVFPLALIVFMPFVGRISDRVGKRKMLAIAIVAEIVAFSLYVANPHASVIIFSRVLDAVAAATLSLITLAKAEDVIRKNRGEKGGYFLSIGHVGRVVGPPISVIIADVFFIQSPFLVSIAILGALLLLLFDKRDFHFRRLHPADLDYLGNIKRYLSDRRLRGMAVIGMAIHAAHLPVIIFLPLFIINDLGQPLLSVGVAIFLLEASHLFQFFFGRLSDRFGPARLVTAGVVIFALGLMSLFFVSTFEQLLLVVALAGVGTAMWNVSAWHVMGEVGKEMRGEGLVVTSYVALASVGALVSSVLSGLFIEAYSFQALMVVVGAVILVAAGPAYLHLRGR